MGGCGGCGLTAGLPAPRAWGFGRPGLARRVCSRLRPGRGCCTRSRLPRRKWPGRRLSGRPAPAYPSRRRLPGGGEREGDDRNPYHPHHYHHHNGNKNSHHSLTPGVHPLVRSAGVVGARVTEAACARASGLSRRTSTVTLARTPVCAHTRSLTLNCSSYLPMGEKGPGARMD